MKTKRIFLAIFSFFMVLHITTSLEEEVCDSIQALSESFKEMCNDFEADIDASAQLIKDDVSNIVELLKSSGATSNAFNLKTAVLLEGIGTLNEAAVAEYVLGIKDALNLAKILFGNILTEVITACKKDTETVDRMKTALLSAQDKFVQTLSKEVSTFNNELLEIGLAYDKVGSDLFESGCVGKQDKSKCMNAVIQKSIATLKSFSETKRAKLRKAAKDLKEVFKNTATETKGQMKKS